MKRLVQISILLGFVFLLSGCRGYLTDKTPIHLNPNMDWQAKYKAQQLSMHPPDGTVPFGDQSIALSSKDRADVMKLDTVLYHGKNANGTYVKKVPMAVTNAFLDRGEERYNIYCAVCHTKTGDGTKSVISERGWIVSDIRQDVTVARPDGELFEIISNGVRTMPGYAKQISEEDRWAVVAYVRALQKVNRGQLRDVPEQKRSEIR